MPIETYFVDGAILYFDPFIFSDGGEPKPKYFLVLKRTDVKCVLASLPTSKDSVPIMIEKRHGCINDDDISFNCYYFDPDVVVCDDGFSFPIGTYIYGFRLQVFDLNVFLSQELSGKTVIKKCGVLKVDEYQSVVRCLVKSSSVKHAYRKILSA